MNDAWHVLFWHQSVVSSPEAEASVVKPGMLHKHLPDRDDCLGSAESSSPSSSKTGCLPDLCDALHMSVVLVPEACRCC